MHAAKRQHREATTTHGMRGFNNHSGHRETSRELKTQRKDLKHELKTFIKEAKALRKADRKVRKAERKGRRAQRRAEKKQHKKGRKGGDGGAAREARKAAEAEAKALRAQRKVVVAAEVARIMAAEPGRESERVVREREAEAAVAGERAMHLDLANRIMDGTWGLEEGTKALAVSDDVAGQENGVVVQEK